MVSFSFRADGASFVFGLATCAALGGCSLVHHEASGFDAGAAVVDAAVAVLVIDAAPPGPPPPDNVNDVGRFPDEVSANDAVAKIADANVSARNAVPGGALVSTLKLGTPVTQIATHGNFVLCSFADPKNPSRLLEGWIAEQAFVPGPTIPSKAACPSGQTRLMFDEQDFCGRVCKAPTDCPTGQVCTGKANLFASGKAGAEVATCTIPLTPSPTPSAVPGMPHFLPLPFPVNTNGTAAPNPGAAPRFVPNVQMPALPGNACLGGWVFGDGQLCHRDCSHGPCPGGSRCVRMGAGSGCEAM